MYFYLIYGLCLSSDTRFPNLPDTHQQPVDFHLSWQSGLPPIPPGSPFYSSPYKDLADNSLADFYIHPDGYVLVYPGLVSFRIDGQEIVITCMPEHSPQAADLLLADVLSFLLELRGILALHASACVSPRGGAVAFMGHSTAGKSSLASGLVAAGFGLLTDDILPVSQSDDHFLAFPGYPAMNMRAEQARHFVPNYQDYPTLQPGNLKWQIPIGPGGWGVFCEKPQAIRALFVTSRRAKEDADISIQIQPVPGAQAVIEVVRYSFTPRLVAAMGLGAQRLRMIASLVQSVPVYQIIYPSGYDLLPRVIAEIEEKVSWGI